MGRNSHVVLEAHDVRRETGTEPRYRAIFDPDMPIAMPNMAKKRDLRYWLSLPRIGAWGGAGRDSERQRAARRALPPTSNTGGKSAPQAEAQDLSPELQQISLVLENGEIKQVMVRAGWGDDLAHIDQVSFTIHESTCHVIAGHMMVADDEYILTMSQRLFQIFGFGVSHKRPKGMNFYRDTWVLGQEDVCYGNLSFGGQRNTMLIQLTATGCNAANSGWEKRLYDFLQHEAENPRLTRVDCAYDDFNGDYNADVMNEEVRAGRFNCGGRNPFVERHGDWDNPDGSGRTLYVGKRKNGKFCRGYEKGKQLGSPSSNWFRVEVEFKGVDRIIPLEILLNAGSYLAGAYPAFARFKGMKTPERIETIIKGQEYSLDHHLHYAALQVGRLVNYMREVASWSVESIVERLARPEAGYPQRLKLAHISCELGNQDFVHDYAHVDYDTDAFVRMAREEWHAGARFAHA